VNKENTIFAICGFVLGAILGALILGPWITRMQAESPKPVTSALPSAPQPSQTDSASGAPVMNQVLQEIALLQEVLKGDPKNFDALVRLGNLYMDAVKWDRAAEFYARAVAVRKDPDVVTDLGICYRQSGRPEQALQLFDEVQRDNPAHWQSAFNRAIALADLKRFDEARAVVAALKKQRPTDPQVDQLASALANAK